MCEIDSVMDTKGIWLGDLLSQSERIEIERICLHFNYSKLSDSQVISPHSPIAKRGFVPPTDTSSQAYYQVLAHMGCIPSCLLFGLSLSEYPPRSKRLLSQIHAFEYMYLGVESLLNNQTNDSFLNDAAFIFKTNAMLDILRFVVQEAPTLGSGQQDPKVIKFAEIWLNGMAFRPF